MLLDLTFPFCCEINALVCFNHIEHPFLFPCLLPKPHFLEYNARRTTRILITLQPSNPFVCRCLVPLINLPITNKVHSLAASMSEAELEPSLCPTILTSAALVRDVSFGDHSVVSKLRLSTALCLDCDSGIQRRGARQSMRSWLRSAT